MKRLEESGANTTSDSGLNEEVVAMRDLLGLR
jgi:hypothetical protein